MKKANVSTLRARLSRILDAVRQGEEVEILERDVPIARVVPVSPHTEGRKGKLPPWLEGRRKAGVIRVGSLRPVAEILKGFPPGASVAGTAAIEAILEERRSGR